MVSVQSLVGVVAVSFFATIILFLGVYPPMLVSVESASLRNTGTVNGESSLNKMQYVYGDRIFDGNGSEVVWRGAGGSYLFHSNYYILAWEKHLPEIKAMGLNTVRLAFRFPDSNPGENGFVDSDTLDYGKLEEVLAWLDMHGLKAILDCHNYKDMYGDFGSQKLIDDWVALAEHFKDDARIVAYELFNEPGSVTWASWLRSKEDVVKAYANLTDAVRAVDPDRIVIWQSSHYLPAEFPEGFAQYLRPNVVYTVHRWYRSLTRDKEVFEAWTEEELSYMTIRHLVEMREKVNAPFWLGEFGSHKPFNESNQEWLLTEQLLFRCEEQVLGWNLWMGRTGIDKPWNAYLPFFPLKVYNLNLVRKPWVAVPDLLDYIVEQYGVDRLEPFKVEMWHNKDYVTFDRGIIIRIIINHRLQNETFEVVSNETVKVFSQLTIRNEEHTETHPGDWNTKIYLIGFSS